jgi:hypothetical protein
MSKDFVLRLLRSKKDRNSIFIVNRFSKIAQFISFHKPDYTTNTANLFFRKIVWLHCVSRNIMSNRNVIFLGYF